MSTKKEPTLAQVAEQLADIETTLEAFDARLIAVEQRCSQTERDVEHGDNNLADEIRHLRSDINSYKP